MQKFIYQIIFFVILMVILFSCNMIKGVITGEIRAVNGDTVQIRHYRFKVLGNVPKINDYCTFTPTGDSSKVNCIKLQ